MAKERRTDITGEQKPTTRREAVVGSETDRNPTVGRKTTIRPATGKATVIRPGTGKDGSVKTGYVRRKKFPLDKLIVGVVIAVVGYYGWGYYQKELSGKKEREAAKLAAAQQEEADRIARDRIAEEARRKKAAEEESKRLEAQRKLEEAAAAKERAEVEAEAARRQAEADKVTAAQAEETAKREAVARAHSALEKLKTASKEAKELSREGKFAEAGKLIESKLAEVGASLLPGEDKSFLLKQKAADAFAVVMAQTKPAPESSAENMYWFTLRNGGKLRGKVASDLGSEVVLIGNGGVRSSLLASSIASRIEVSQKELDNELKSRVELRAKGAKTGVDWFLLGMEALLGNQPSYAVRAFNKAEEMDPAIGQNIREHRARFLLASGIFNRAINNQRIAKERLDRLVNEFGDTRAARIFQNADAEEGTLLAQVTATDSEEGDGSAEPVEATTTTAEAVAEAKAIDEELDKALEGLSGNASIAKADALVTQARSLEEKAQSTEDTAKANEFYKDAAGKLMQALAMYRESKSDKKIDQGALGKKMSDASSRLYWCRKLQTL